MGYIRPESKKLQKEFRGQKYDPNVSYQQGVTQPEIIKDMIDAYQLHPWVYAAVYAIATNIASIDFDIFLRQKNGDKIDESHPFKKLLERPNPFITPYQLKEWTSIVLEMTGNAYWLLERDKSGTPYEIWPVPTHMIRPVASATSMIDHYVYEVDGRIIQYEYNDVIHFQQTNPKMFTFGQPSIHAAVLEVTTDMFAASWNKNFFRNFTSVGTVLETEGTLDAPTRQRTLEAWNQFHQGVKKAHKTAILEGGLKLAQNVQKSHTDMDFINQRKASREMILSVFGVPPAIVGVLEYANYANIKEQTSIFWKYTLLPKLRRMESILTMRGAQITFRPNSYFQANLSVVESLRPDMLSLSNISKNFTDIGIPLNQVIDALDLPFDHVDGGDESRPVQRNPNTGEIIVGTEKSINKEVSDEEIKKWKRFVKWKKFDDDLTENENKIRPTIKSIFRGQFKRVIKDFKNNASKILGTKGLLFSKPTNTKAFEISLLWDDGEEELLFTDSIKPKIRNIFFESVKKAGKKIDPKFVFDLDDPYAKDWIDKKTFKLVREANSTTKEHLSEAVVEGIEEAVKQGYNENETIDEITERLEEVHDFMMEGRAELIARTESLSATNAGQLEGLKRTGIEKKEWLSSRDSRVRESHDALDGDVVGINEDFISISGDHLNAPGDSSASIGEIANCRCTIIPVISEEKE